MSNKIHIVPAILLSAYLMPELFAYATLVALVGSLAFIGYLRYKFWFILGKKVLDYKV